MSVTGNNFIGLRVGYLDYTGTPCSGTVVFQKPHNREPEIVWFGILNDNPDLNDKPLQKPDGTLIYVSDYLRSDQCSPLIDIGKGFGVFDDGR